LGLLGLKLRVRVKGIRRILVRESMPPCHPRRIFFENLTMKWCILIGRGMVGKEGKGGEERGGGGGNVIEKSRNREREEEK